ncbi:MAG: adenosylcobinamide-GDP ribazoletransferase [Actinomycetes bacterium]
MADLLAGLRLSISTLTVVRLPTGRVDRAAAAVAMASAPLVGLVLASVMAALAYGARLAWHSGLVTAVVVVASLAAVSGFLHLDGLADTADGVGAPAGRDRLAIMKNPGIGAFGAAALVFVLIAQVVALGRCIDVGLGTVGVLTAVTVSRLTAPFGCLRGLPAARTDGLGATVAGTVSPGVAAAVAAVTTAVLVGAVAVHDGSWHNAGRVLWSVVAALVAGVACHRVAVRRIGGITGDVLGAGIELSTAVALLAVCVRG